VGDIGKRREAGGDGGHQGRFRQTGSRAGKHALVVSGFKTA
jgi:hypothetical protein